MAFKGKAVKKKSPAKAPEFRDAYVPVLMFKRVVTPEIREEYTAAELALQLARNIDRNDPVEELPNEKRFHVLLYLAGIVDDIFDNYDHPGSHRAIFMETTLWHSQEGVIPAR